MPTVYILTGLPGSGKTTWVGHNFRNPDNAVWTGTDKFIDRIARQQGKTYNQVFADYMPTAISLMIDEVLEAFSEDKNLVWDQTSLTVESRAKKLKMVPPHYKKVAVIFSTPRPEIHKKMLDRPGKIIPESVLENMKNSFVEPTLSEGFDEIQKPSLLGLTF